MIKSSYFQCEKKGKVLVLCFADAEEITVQNLIPFLNCEADRYVKLVLESDGEKVSVNMVKNELDNKDIIKFSKEWLLNDLNDYLAIKNADK